MTVHYTDTGQDALVEEVAGVVLKVAGVAFLKPGLGERLRSALSRPVPPGGGDRSAGVRMVLPQDGRPWHVEIQVVVDRRARALDVSRAVHATVTTHLSILAPDGPEPRVTVTVTGRV